MKVLGNITALIAVLFVMGGLLLFQHDYQNRYSGSAAMELNAAAGVQSEPAGQYKVVLK